MISKTKVNRSFSGTVRYVLGKTEAEIVGGNMWGDRIQDLTYQFEVNQRHNPYIKDPCYHLMLSIPTTERLVNNNEWSAIAERHFATLIVLSRLTDGQNHVHNPDKRINPEDLNKLVDLAIIEDVPKYSYVAVKHNDADHSHIHIVADRINLETARPIRTWYDRYHAQYSCRVLEDKFNLQPAKSIWEIDRENKTIDGQRAEQIIRDAIDLECQAHPPLPQLIKRLWDEHQIRTVVNFSSVGVAKGIKYGIEIQNNDGEKMVWKQGNNLGAKYTLQKLQTKMGVQFDPASHNLEVKWLVDWIDKQAAKTEDSIVPPSQFEDLNHPEIESLEIVTDIPSVPTITEPHSESKVSVEDSSTLNTVTDMVTLPEIPKIVRVNQPTSKPSHGR